MDLVHLEPQLVAVVQREARWDALMDAIRSAMAVDLRPVRPLQRGHNVFVYWPRGEGRLTLWVGFQVAAPFDPVGEIVCATIPGGEAAHAVHTGPYSELSRTWEPLLADIRGAGLSTSGVQWELYGDHDEDPARLRTDVFVLVRPVVT